MNFSIKCDSSTIIIIFFLIAFVTNLAVPNKQFFSENLFVGLRNQLTLCTMYSIKIKIMYKDYVLAKTMYRFKIKLLYNDSFALKKSC